MKKHCVLLTALFIACGAPVGMNVFPDVGFTAEAQSNKVTGVVKDADGEPLIGVTIKVKGTNKVSVTDINGRYSITAPAGSTLVFSYIGLKPKEVPAAQASTVVMEAGSNQLNEVVVTGEYGMKRVERAVGSSVQNVKAVDIEASGRTDFISALQGRGAVSKVRFVTASILTRQSPDFPKPGLCFIQIFL